MKFDTYLVEEKLTLAAFGALVPVSAPTVSNWATGKKFPRPDHLARIGELTGGRVTADDFLAMRQRRRAPPAGQAVPA